MSASFEQDLLQSAMKRTAQMQEWPARSRRPGSADVADVAVHIERERYSEDAELTATGIDDVRVRDRLPFHSAAHMCELFVGQQRRHRILLCDCMRHRRRSSAGSEAALSAA